MPLEDLRQLPVQQKIGTDSDRYTFVQRTHPKRHVPQTLMLIDDSSAQCPPAFRKASALPLFAAIVYAPQRGALNFIDISS